MGTWKTVRVGHLNLWRENKRAKKDLRKLLPLVDVLTLNEAAKHYAAIREVCGEQDFGFIHADGSGFNARQNVILYRQSVFQPSEVPTAVELMCEATAGTPERYMVSKRLVHAGTKRVLKVRSTHMNAHVEKKSWQALPRFSQYLWHGRNLRRSMGFSKESPAVQLLGMDCNANYRLRRVRLAPVFPWALLRTVGARSSYAVVGRPGAGTKGHRLIDGVWLMRAPFARFVSHRIVGGLGSDHNALVVTLQIR